MMFIFGRATFPLSFPSSLLKLPNVQVHSRTGLVRFKCHCIKFRDDHSTLLQHQSKLFMECWYRAMWWVSKLFAQLKSLVVTYIKSLWSGLKSKVLRFRPFNLRLFFLSSGKLPEAGCEVLFILIASISSAKLASFSPSAVSLLILLTEDSVTHWQYLCQVLIIQWNFSVSCYQMQNLTRFRSNTLLGWPTSLFRLHNLLHSQICTLAIILFFTYRLLSHW